MQMAEDVNNTSLVSAPFNWSANKSAERRCFLFPLTLDEAKDWRKDSVAHCPLSVSQNRAPGYNTGSLLALDDIKRSSTKSQQCSSTTSALNHGPGGPGRKIWAQN